MAIGLLQLDFELAGTALIAGLQPNSAFWGKQNLRIVQGLPENGRHAAKVWRGRRQAPSEKGRMTPEELHEFSWQELFLDPTYWWDNQRGEKDFRPKTFKDSLWSNKWCNPACVDSQVAMVDVEMRNPAGSVATTVQGRPGKAELFGDDLEVATCSRLCEDGQVIEAVDTLNLLIERGCRIPRNLFYRLLKGCMVQKDLVLGRRVHALTITSRYESDAFLANHLICMYASHGSLVEAMQVFSKVSAPDAYMWASIILAYARHGQPTQAIGLYRQMRESTVKPDNPIFVAVLKACATARDLTAGKDVHAHILERAEKPDMVVQNSLVNMYSKCGSLEDARGVFDGLSQKNTVTWTAMIAGYAQQGLGQEALSLYTIMQQENISPPDPVTFVCLLQACAGVGVAGLHQGKQIHAHVEKRGLQDDVVLGATLVNMYSKCGSLGDARTVFNNLSQKDVVTWTAMIAGYVEQGMGQEALSLYSRMQQERMITPNSVTFVCLLQACGCVGVAALQQGKQLHAQIEKRGLQADLSVGTTLVHMYAKCGSLENARKLFDGLPQKNVVTWTAMIAGYAQQGLCQEALSLYNSMRQEGITQPNPVTFACLLQACASVAALPLGKQLHAQIEELEFQADAVVGSSLVHMYAKCGALGNAQRVFDGLPQKDVVTWTAMIAGYAQQGMGQEALSLYSKMQQGGITLPDSVTFVCLLQACASVAALPLGKQLHVQIEERGLQADVVVGPSLVNMYAKCGSLVDAQQVFDSLQQRDIVAWSALIAGYARQGDSEIVFDLVDKMKQEGIEPNGITFLSVLTVCSHVGLVDRGRNYFEAMRTDYGIAPAIEHYRCMMDLLGRAGYLEEALQMAKSMPFEPNGVVWLTLLGACRKWNNVEVGREAFEFAVSIDEKDGAAYVLMSNIYAGAQMWEEAEELQSKRKEFGAWKQPGQTWWTDIDGVSHTFVAGRRKHSESEGVQISDGPIVAAAKHL